MKKAVILLSLALALMLFLQSCDKIEQIGEFIKNPFQSETQTEAETTLDELSMPETMEIQRAEFVDPITGEPADKDMSNSRPVAIVVKNDRSASPQYGLSDAAVLYEASVEGGLTRFLAVYSDVSKADKIGPVIDSRTYFYDFAANHNAIFVQAGTTNNGNKVQVSRGITALDAIVGEMTPGFYRDQILMASRGMESPFSIIISGRAKYFFI